MWWNVYHTNRAVAYMKNTLDSQIERFRNKSPMPNRVSLVNFHKTFGHVCRMLDSQVRKAYRTDYGWDTFREWRTFRGARAGCISCSPCCVIYSDAFCSNAFFYTPTLHIEIWRKNVVRSSIRGFYYLYKLPLFLDFKIMCSNGKRLRKCIW